MKRILTLFVFAVLAATITGCQKDPAGAGETAKCSYTVKMAMTNVSASSTVHYDLMAFEYNEAGEKTGNNTITMATTGKSQTYTANDRSVKVKLYIKMYTDKSSYTEHKWVQQVFYLEKGKTIEVALADNSLVGNKEP